MQREVAKVKLNQMLIPNRLNLRWRMLNPWTNSNSLSMTHKNHSAHILNFFTVVTSYLHRLSIEVNRICLNNISEDFATKIIQKAK